MAAIFGRCGRFSVPLYTCRTPPTSLGRNFSATTLAASINCAVVKPVGSPSIVTGNAVPGARGFDAVATSVVSSGYAAGALSKDHIPRDFPLHSWYIPLSSLSSFRCRAVSCFLSSFYSSSHALSPQALGSRKSVAEETSNFARSAEIRATLQQQLHQQNCRWQRKNFRQQQESQGELQAQQRRKNHRERRGERQQHQDHQQKEQHRQHGKGGPAAALLAVSPVLFTEWDSTSDPKSELLFLVGHTLGYCTEKFFENEYGQSIFACVLGLVYLALLGYEGKINGAVWRMKHVFGTNMKLVGHPRYAYALPKNPLLGGSQSVSQK